MTDASEDQTDKPYEATRRKLEDARRKGEIVRSQDVVNLVVLIAFVICVQAVFGGVLTGIVFDIQNAMEQSISGERDMSVVQSFRDAFRWITPLLLILFLGPFVIVMVGLIAARQVVFTVDKLQPKLNRISPIASAKKKYGVAGLFEFGKNLGKFFVFASVLAVFLSDGQRLFQSAISRSEHIALEQILRTSVRWLWFTVVAYVAFAVIDALWQVQEHARKNRMSHKELKDEHKNEQGDEHIRQQRRAKAEEIATNRMLLDVPKATVVIVNPTHYAVALQWSGEKNTVPKCVARGTGETARRIREIAVQSGVPLYRDPPTARELYAKVKVGMMIDRDHYKAVAAAMGYARRIQGMLRT